MNVLHINQTDKIGGAGIAAYRLHQGLLARGVDSRLLVGFVSTKSPRTKMLKRMRGFRRATSIVSRMIGLNDLLLPFGFGVQKYDFYKDADVINLHNLHTGYINYLATRKIAFDRPTVYTLHDMWSFTGHCANSYDCDKWKTGCGKCPYPKSYPSIGMDNTRLEWKLKNWLYRNSNINIVTPSRWLRSLVEQSVLQEFPIHHIPHGICTDTFRPYDQKTCHKIIGIPEGKKVVAFGAANLADPMKGGKILYKALSELPISLKKELVLVTFGEGAVNAVDTGIQEIQMGYIANDGLKAIVYSAADVFLLASLAESFGLVLEESLACGTPVVAFDVGGIPDIVTDQKTGRLVTLKNVKEFREAIEQVLDDKDLREKMRRQCRIKAEKEFGIELQVDRYMNIYNEMLEDRN